MKLYTLVLAACGLAAAASQAAEPTFPLLLSEDFSAGAARWEPTDPKAWKVGEDAGNKFFSQHAKSDYSPPYRSPFNIALLKDIVVGDFVLEARCRSTVKDYGHRDMCLFFGYQDPAHFYYVHLGKNMDDHANQIFIVNSAPRIKISSLTSEGTPWTDAWHRVKLVRRVGDGTIEVYYDDMERPVMKATNKTFTWGRIGLGTFDDTGDWDDVRLHGVKVEKGT
jgi:hypothetical protein